LLGTAADTHTALPDAIGSTRIGKRLGFTVPTVVMSVVALSDDGSPLPQTLRSHVIARRVHYNQETDAWTELSDTRLMPEESVAVELLWDGSSRARAWLDVIPDDFYATQKFLE
jgi:hypothetical protein